MNEETRQQVRERDDHKCRFCETEENLHTHHIIPRSAGGSDDKENLITVCQSCHNTIESTQGKALKRLKGTFREEITEEKIDEKIDKRDDIIKVDDETIIEKSLYRVKKQEIFGLDSLFYIGFSKENAVEELEKTEEGQTHLIKENVEIQLSQNPSISEKEADSE